MVVHESGAAEPGGGRTSGRAAVRGLRREQLSVPDADRDLLRQRRPAARRRLQPERSQRAARQLRDHVSRGAARSADAGARGTAPALLGFSANATFPSPNGFAPAYNWNNGVPSYAAPPFFDPTLNSGFATGRPSGGDVTYGDPEIGGRPPRYQNWNAGMQFALTRSMTFGATYAGSKGDALGGTTRGFFSNQLDPQISGARQPADAARRRRRTSPRRRRSCLAWACPTRTSRARSRRCCGRSRNTTASTTSTATSRARRITRCS